MVANWAKTNLYELTRRLRSLESEITTADVIDVDEGELLAAKDHLVVAIACYKRAHGIEEGRAVGHEVEE